MWSKARCHNEPTLHKYCIDMACLPCEAGGELLSLTCFGIEIGIPGI
jgi:hypothetical protein